MTQHPLLFLFRGKSHISAGDDSYKQCFPITVEDAIAQNRGPFFSVNPISATVNLNDKGAKVPKADINVTEFRNFVFECDSSAVTLADQLQALNWLTSQVPIQLITYSGNKSYHVIISLETPLALTPHESESVSTYKQVWKGLCAYLEGLLYVRASEQGQPWPETFFDRATQNPSRSTRMPGYVRPDTGKTQSVAYVGQKMATEFAISVQAPRVSETTPPSVPVDSSSLSDFERSLKDRPSLKGLRTKTQMPYSWVKSSGMYKELLQLTLWAIDSSDVSYPVWNMYLQKHVYPALIEVGYPRYKLELGPRNAYLYKNKGLK